MTANEQPPVRIPVDLGERSYEVLVGSGMLAHILDHLPNTLSGRIAIVTDSTVAKHHLETLVSALGPSRRLRGTVTVPAGEQSKSFLELARVCSRLLELGVERGDLVLAFGGGVVGDLAGFAAAILRRGIRFIQIPTTLLAQVDSSVGGKTGINTPEGKNLVGSFHQPSFVLADTDLLTTLPPRQLRAGYAEIAKCAVLGDVAFFDWLEREGPAALAGDTTRLREAIARCIAMKARIVATDERETGPRALLNLGHTFGHALEAFTGFSNRLLHGEAVAIGMGLAAQLSEDLGCCPPGIAARVRGHLARVGLPTAVADIPGPRPGTDDLVRLMQQDKKVRDGALTFILLSGIGNAIISRDVPHIRLHALLVRETGI